MSKILKYALGVIVLLNTAVVYAAEKFDVLPDLPDPLAYAVPSAEAASVSGNIGNSLLGTQSVGQAPSIITVLLSLIFVVLLIYLTGIIYAKLNNVGFKTLKKQQGDYAKSHVAVVSTTQLGNNKTLHVVELDGKRMLIGASASTIQLIKDLGATNNGEIDEEYSHIEIPNIKIPKIEIPKIEIPSIGFKKLKTKTHKNIERIEQEESAENGVSFETNPNENENPDIIIDSLFSTQNHIDSEEEEEEVAEKNEHSVDPDEYALYKKYLG